jgi:hypothetical protein
MRRHGELACDAPLLRSSSTDAFRDVDCEVR